MSLVPQSSRRKPPLPRSIASPALRNSETYTWSAWPELAGRPLTPDSVGETLVRDERAAGDQQADEERALLRATAKRRSVHLQRPQYPELHDSPFELSLSPS